MSYLVGRSRLVLVRSNPSLSKQVITMVVHLIALAHIIEAIQTAMRNGQQAQSPISIITMLLRASIYMQVTVHLQQGV